MRNAALIVLLVAGSAGGAEDAVPKTEGRAAKSGEVAQFGTLDDCLKDKRCWSLVLMAYGDIFRESLREIEAAEPGRFFPGATIFALERPNKTGDFLRAECSRTGKGPCDDFRDQLEFRTMVVTLFRCLPIREKPRELYDEKTWEIKPAGQDALAKIKKRHPNYMTELAKIIRNRKEA